MTDILNTTPKEQVECCLKQRILRIDFQEHIKVAANLSLHTLYITFYDH